MFRPPFLGPSLAWGKPDDKLALTGDAGVLPDRPGARVDETTNIPDRQRADL